MTWINVLATYTLGLFPFAVILFVMWIESQKP